MTTQDDLVALIAQEFPDNGSGAITAEVLRIVTEVLAEYATGHNGPSRTAEYFGCQAVGFDSEGEPAETPIDNLAALELARDWSIERGGRVEFGGGIYGHDGTFHPESHINFQGAGRDDTEFLSLHTNNADCWSTLKPGDDPDVDGAAQMTLRDFSINGGWDKTGSGGSWNYDQSEMPQRGFLISAPLNSAAVRLIHRGGVDTYDQIRNIRVEKVAGTCMQLEGRGEKMMSGLRLNAGAIGGLLNNSPDNWISEITSSGHGVFGTKVTAGNQRMWGWKVWFCGMWLTDAPDAAFIYDGSSNKAIRAFGIDVQDAWGPAYDIQGSGIKVSGWLDECCGGRLVEQGNGYQGARGSNDNAYVLIRNGESCEISVTASGVIDNGFNPRIARVASENASMHYMDYNVNVPGSNINEAVNAAGTYDPDVSNVVVKRRRDGALLFGGVSIANLNNGAHEVNLNKLFGSTVLLDDGRPAISTGGPSASWIDALGTVIATPV